MSGRQDESTSDERDSGDRFWEQRPVLVTGSTGIVGSWLAKALLDRTACVVALVQDATSAYLRLATSLNDDRCRGQAFNFSNEAPVTLLDIVSRIQALMGCEGLEPDVRDEATGEIRSQNSSAAKARRLLAWRPAFDLESGRRETIDWYRAYFSGQVQAWRQAGAVMSVR